VNTLKIERIGGLAGFGLPGSKVQSNQFRRFLTADQASVEALFQNPPLREEQQRDGFRYRITRTVKGNKQTVEVPESAVPAALKACVSDKLIPPDEDSGSFRASGGPSSDPIPSLCGGCVLCKLT